MKFLVVLCLLVAAIVAEDAVNGNDDGRVELGAEVDMPENDPNEQPQPRVIEVEAIPRDDLLAILQQADQKPAETEDSNDGAEKSEASSNEEQADVVDVQLVAIEPQVAEDDEIEASPSEEQTEVDENEEKEASSSEEQTEVDAAASSEEQTEADDEISVEREEAAVEHVEDEESAQ